MRRKRAEPQRRMWRMGIAHPDRCWIELDTFDTAVNAALKTELPGPPRFHNATKRWIFPLNWDTCLGARRVADKFCADIVLTDPMREWAIAEKQRQETIPDVNSMALTDLPTIRTEHPLIWDAISARPFQSVGAAFAARNRSCLIADQPGLGKTIQSISAIIESNITGPILVVAPKAAARLTWPQELKKWVPGDEVVVIGSHQRNGERQQVLREAINHSYDADHTPMAGFHNLHQARRVWIITSPNYLRVKAETDQFKNFTRDDNGKKIITASGEGLVELLDVTWSAVIVDESHQTLPVPTGNVKKQSAQRQGIGALEVKPDGLRLALSGTPFRGKEVYLWGTLNWLRPDMYRSYWKWVEKHFDCWRDRYGMQIGRMVDVEGMYAEAAKVMIRRTKAEVAKDLPPKIYNDIWLDMDPKQATAYRQMERDAAATLDGGQLLANGLLAEMTRLKQFAGSYGDMVGDTFKPRLPSNKFDWLVEFLDERGIDKDILKLDDSGNGDPREARKALPKIVVSSQFSQLINIIHDGLNELGISSYKFTGETNDKDRDYIKNDWQEKPTSSTRVLLLTTTAGGVSLTLDAASELVLLDETYNPADQEQVEDRIHRLSRMHQVTIWNVRSNGTIEEGIAKQNLERETNIKDIIDGERGVNFAKLVMNRG